MTRSLYKPSQSSLSNAGLHSVTHPLTHSSTGHLRCSFVRGMMVTVSQVVALLSSALSGVEVTDEDEDCRRWSGRGKQDNRPAVEQCCVVCISTCGDGEEVRRLPCGHAFHRDCVDRWLARCRRTCPLCRLHVGGVGLLDDDQHQLSEDLVIWFSSLFVAGL
jgi:hypothetical protein